MQSLRDRQIREVLDEDLNINRRVNDLTLNKVRLSEETVAPKKTRDLEIEVSVDKLIENLNKILETKTTALEYLLTRITRGEGEIGDAEGRRAFNAVVNNGDFITSYNQLIRLYTQPSLARATTDMIRTKFQEIKDNIDAILYGLSEVVQYLFGEGIPSKDIFQLVRSQAVYDFVKNTLYRGSSYKIIEQNDISTSIQNVLSELSEVQRAELKRISEANLREKSLLKLPIEMTADEDRLRALEDEIGFRFPENLRGTLGKKEYQTIESEYGQLQGDITAMDREQLDTWISQIRREDASLAKTEQHILRQLQQLQKDRDEYLTLEFSNLPIEDEDMGDQKHDLEGAYGAEIAEINKKKADLEEELYSVQERRAEIGTRIENMKREYEANVAKRTGEFVEKVGLIKPKRVGSIEGVETLTQDGLSNAVKGKSMADAHAILLPIAKRFNYTPREPKDVKGVKAIIKNILDKQSEEEKARSREGLIATRTLTPQLEAKIQNLREALRDEYKLEDLPDKKEVVDLITGDTLVKAKNQLVLDELLNRFNFTKFDIDTLAKGIIGYEPPKPAEARLEMGQPAGINWAEMGFPELEEEAYLKIEGDGRFKKRSKRALIPHRVMDFRDARNDVFKLKGKGFFTDVAKKFADIFS